MQRRSTYPSLRHSSRIVVGRLLAAFAVAFAVMAIGPVGTVLSPSPAAAQQADEEVPPGNPVIGSDRPGDIEPENDTRYGLWALLAVCLIGAGFLLVRIERWERQRSKPSTSDQ